MKIICTKQNLAKGVSIVSKAVPSKTTMPILECILIDASTDVIKLTANDMELGIETSIDGEIIERGILALSQVEKQNLKSHHFREMNFLIFQTLRKMIL